jgi:transcriptional regulator NrdR family protein
MIKCPHCDSEDTFVRVNKGGANQNLRYRTCKDCAKTFTTMEIICVSAGRRRGMVLDLEEQLRYELINQPSEAGE